MYLGLGLGLCLGLGLAQVSGTRTKWWFQDIGYGGFVVSNWKTVARLTDIPWGRLRDRVGVIQESEASYEAIRIDL